MVQSFQACEELVCTGLVVLDATTGFVVLDLPVVVAGLVELEVTGLLEDG